MTLLKGRKYRAWWPFLPLEGARELGVNRTVMGYRVMPNGTLDPIGRRIPGHPSLSGNTAPPRNKRRTIFHKKGSKYPGRWG